MIPRTKKRAQLLFDRPIFDYSFDRPIYFANRVKISSKLPKIMGRAVVMLDYNQHSVPNGLILSQWSRKDSDELKFGESNINFVVRILKRIIVGFVLI